VAQPTCCANPDWKSEIDLGEAGGFDYLLVKCDRCGAYSMKVFCVASGISGIEPVSAKDVEQMKALGGRELKAFMREWGDIHL